MFETWKAFRKASKKQASKTTSDDLLRSSGLFSEPLKSEQMYPAIGQSPTRKAEPIPKTNESLGGQRLSRKHSRWTRPHYIPSSFVSNTNLTQSSSCPEVESKKLSIVRKSGSSAPPTNPPPKTHALGLHAKEALGRFFSTAKRSLTIDATKNGQTSENASSKTHLRRRLISKPTISYPMKLHHPDYSFIASHDPWVDGPKPATPLRRHATTIGRPTRPPRSGSILLSRAQTTRRPGTLRLSHHSTTQTIVASERELLTRPSAPEPIYSPPPTESESMSTAFSSEDKLETHSRTSIPAETQLGRPVSRWSSIKTPDGSINPIRHSGKPSQRASPIPTRLSGRLKESYPDTPKTRCQSFNSQPLRSSLRSVGSQYSNRSPTEEARRPTVSNRCPNIVEEDITVTLMGCPHSSSIYPVDSNNRSIISITPSLPSSPAISPPPSPLPLARSGHENLSRPSSVCTWERPSFQSLVLNEIDCEANGKTDQEHSAWYSDLMSSIDQTLNQSS